MVPNPYEPPRPLDPVAPRAVALNRTPFLLAGAGALLASAYWALLTMLIGVASAMGKGSPAQLVLPLVLIVLYAVRGFQLFKCDPNAARRILWLHGVGGVVAAMQIASGTSVLVMGLQSMKLLIHVFGGVTALMAQRAYAEAMR